MTGQRFWSASQRSWSALRSRFAFDEHPGNGDTIPAQQATTFTGRSGRWNSNTSNLWVFVEGSNAGNRVWNFGGEGRVERGRFFYDFLPLASQRGQRLTLTAVQATPACDRQFRNIQPGQDGLKRVPDPPPEGCRVLGSVSFIVEN